VNFTREEEERMQDKQDTNRGLVLLINTALVFISRLLKLIYVAVQIAN